MRSVLQALGVVLLVTPLIAARAGSEGGGGPSVPVLDEAMERSLAWVEAHPASPRDGGLQDMIDEAVFYRMLQTLAEHPKDRNRFGKRFEARMAALDATPELRDWVQSPRKTLLDHYHLVLAAHLMDEAGAPSAFRAEIARQAGQALAAAPGAHPSFRLTISIFLEYLGQPQGARETLLSRSLIERVAGAAPGDSPAGSGQWGQVGPGAAFALYALVHEVVALTDFGCRPASPWLDRRRGALGRFLTEAAHWAGAVGQVDLVSELAVTLRLLDRPLRGGLDAEMQGLVAAQHADGSWGSSRTSRPNKERHAVQTAAAALWAYRNDRSVGAGTDESAVAR